MSATAERETHTDPFDALTPEMFATPEDEPARESATPDDAPAREPDDEAATSARSRARNERGQFAGKQDAPAEGDDTATDAAAPASEATPAAPAPDPQADLARERAEWERREAALRGQANNAAQQAAERARQEFAAQSKQAARQTITDTLNQMLVDGELSQEQAVRAYQNQQQQWAQEDRQAAEGELTQREAGIRLTSAQAEANQKIAMLQQVGIPRMAEDFGLPVDEVAANFSDDGHMQRFRNAIYQRQMAEMFPGLPFYKRAAEDFLATEAHHLQQRKQLHDHYQGELTKLRAENEQMRVELNREEAGDGLPNPAPVRSGGRRKADTPDEHAERVLTDHLTEFAQAFGLHR